MSVDMNKTIAEASLDNFHYIIVPDAVGYFPPAPGWYVLALLALALLFHLLYKLMPSIKKISIEEKH